MVLKVPQVVDLLHSALDTQPSKTVEECRYLFVECLTLIITKMIHERAHCPRLRLQFPGCALIYQKALRCPDVSDPPYNFCRAVAGAHQERTPHVGEGAVVSPWVQILFDIAIRRRPKGRTRAKSQEVQST